MNPNTPVLVGVGLVSQRESDPRQAREPLALMIDAANAAADDSGARSLLERVERIAVPVGRWRYRNPGKLIAAAVGAGEVTSLSALPGVSQQTLLSDVCGAIWRGEIGAAMVVGGEAGYRLQRAKAMGVTVADTRSDNLADIVLKPQDPMLPEYEQRTGLGQMPVGYYAVIDSAYRHSLGLGTEAYRDRIADRYSQLSAVAAENPHAWVRRHIPANEIRDVAPGNPMLAFPYTKLHNSQWSIDQASALLFCSVAQAEALAVPADRWVFPQVFTEANHMVNITARGQLHRCVGAELAGRAAFDTADCQPADLDFTELYSCFPVAMEVYARELGLPEAAPWSFTGGMPFAGGPFNSFVLHSVGQMAEQIRRGSGSRGLVTTVSGILTKQGFGIWGAEPNPEGYQFVDVTEAVAAATDEREVAPGYQGLATVAGYTVLHDRNGRRQGVVVVDLLDGRRSIANTDDDELMAAMERSEFCGVQVHMDAGHFTV